MSQSFLRYKCYINLVTTYELCRITMDFDQEYERIVDDNYGCHDKSACDDNNVVFLSTVRKLLE